MNTYRLEATYKERYQGFRCTFFDDGLSMAKSIARALVASGDFDGVVLTKDKQEEISFAEEDE
jgi:hypothetical protein